MSKMNDMLSGLRRIVTANDGDGKSHIMIDGGPADEFRTGDLGGSMSTTEMGDAIIAAL